MTPEQLGAETASGKFRPAYYFFGSEDYRITEAEKYLAKQFLPDLQLSTNYRRLDARKSSFAEISAELSAYPMLGERLVVAVTDAQKLTTDQLERLHKFLKPPDPSRLVVFSTPSERAPRKDSAFLKRIVDIAEAVEFKKLTAAETQRHVMVKLKGSGLNIDTKALTMLIDSVAGNRGAVEQEVDKLISYKSTGETISVEDIRQLVGGYEVFVVFDLAKDIISRDKHRALQQIRSLITDGNSPTSILFWVSKFLIELYLVKNGKQLDSKRRWMAWKYREHTAKVDNARLEEMIVKSAEADVAMRRSTVAPEIVLEMLAVELMQL
jgi:DNA polymerase-3 subunit delta